MGSIIIDNTGAADVSFHGIPFNALKKATFLVKKTQALHQLLKIMVNGVTYDIQKTALNGAVLFAENFGRWEFVAPDNRIDFSIYDTMTIGQSFDYLKEVLKESPIPAWNTFIGWVNDILSDDGLNLSNISSSYMGTINGNDIVPVNIIDFTGMVDVISFLEKLENALGPTSESPASILKINNTSIGFKLILKRQNDQGSEVTEVTMAFIFRQ